MNIYVDDRFSKEEQDVIKLALEKHEHAKQYDWSVDLLTIGITEFVQITNLTNNTSKMYKKEVR